MNRLLSLSFILVGVLGLRWILARNRPKADDRPVIQRTFVPLDEVNETSLESFPASDPPGWTGSGI